jgi:DNA-directed RNA polymerase subunit RPC12/RpoP
MPRSTYFVQECPTCGRNLQVRVEYLGKQIVCQHCGARFEASEPGSPADSAIHSNALLERAEYLLQSSASGIMGSRVMASDVVPSQPR